MGGWMDGWVDGWMDGWMDVWMDGWMDGWMDRWVGGCMTYKWLDGSQAPTDLNIDVSGHVAKMPAAWDEVA